jgi:RNA polymerase sigma-70 factor (ECF subfamily)
MTPEPGDCGTITRQTVELFEQHYRLLYKTAYRLTRSHTSAEEVVDTVFLKLIRGSPVQFSKSPLAYLVQATKNEAVNFLRAKERESFCEEDVFDIEVEAPQLAALDPDVLDLQAAMTKLKPDYAETLQLHYVEEYTYREIAKLRGRRLGTVMTDVYRAVRQLRSLMGVEEEGA